mmetsp:Transcript_49160/g.104621  ORF Transcript_49160/g.104621 Transcript_49160/m.104621 type:complete len:615 (+) Transcript_49160:146-1990(+)
MHFTILKWLSLTAVAASIAFQTGALEPEPVAWLPEVPYEALSAGCPRAASEADAALRSFGGLVITGVPKITGTQETLQGWAECLQPASSIREKALKRPLGDLHRVSVTTKMKLGEFLYPWPQCPGVELASAEMRVGVQGAIKALTSSLKMTGSRSQAEALDAVVSEATHLEHLHRYEELADLQEQSYESSHGAEHEQQRVLKALDMHTDAGLLLAFVPPTSAEGRTEETLVKVELPGKSAPIRLALPDEDSVVIFAGAASGLLGEALSWRPMPHALSLKSGFNWRAWYGVMLLLPEHAQVQTPESKTTFGQYWTSARDHVLDKSIPHDHGYSHAPPVSCGDGRKLQDSADACGEGEIECWMQCMSTAGLESCSGGRWEMSGIGNIATYTQTLSIQCLEPSTGQSWPEDISPHCMTCEPTCAFISGSGNSSSTSSSSSNDFCILMSGDMGATMYMDGFHWTAAESDISCLTFLFTSWVLDTRGKFAGACIGAVLLGVFIEFLNAIRRQFAKKKKTPFALAVTYSMGACTLLLAYIIMLLVMTYSLELFLCSIAGLALGPVILHLVGGKGPFRFIEARNDDTDTQETRTVGKAKEVEEAHTGGGAPCCRAAQGMAA